MRLYYHPGNASLVTHILLREMGIPFELVHVDRVHGEHKGAEYLRMNPNGQIPVLVDGDLVLYETAAICLYLAESHPATRLIPPVGDADRPHALKWLMWLTNTLQATLMSYFYPERWVDEGNAEGASQVRAHAQAKVVGLLRQLDDELAGCGGPWMLGERFSLLDPYVFVMGRWTRGFIDRPARDFTHLGPYLQRMLARAPVTQALQAEDLPEPWV